MVPATIKEKMEYRLHTKMGHPLCHIKNTIYHCFPDFEKCDRFSPVVSVEENFDKLLIPQDHPSRRATDTYYLDEKLVLRTHTSAHQNMLLSQGCQKFLVTGDVYRRDTVDRYHYPVFHQMEGVSVTDHPEENLRETLSNLVETLFGNVNWRLVDSYFPFTTPSWEVEIEWSGDWVEVLGCGLIHPKILENCNIEGEGWAFGLGLERLAMILYDIPDIRLFWTHDPRFLEQFENGATKFVPYSKHPACLKDVAFWLTDKYHENDIHEIARERGGDLIESVELIDRFEKGDKVSQCYRISYRSHDRTLTDEEVNKIQNSIRDDLESLVELR